MALMDFAGVYIAILDNGTAELGRACSKLLLDRGANVLLNIHDGQHALPESRAGQGSIPRKMIILTSYGDSEEPIKHALSEFGRLDGVLFVTPTYQSGSKGGIGDERAWTSMRSGDLDGAYRCAKAVWPTLRQQKGGRLVFANTSEGSAVADSTSRFGLFGLAQTLSHEGAKYQIAVNSVTGQTPLYVTGVVDSTTSSTLAKRASAVITSLLHTSGTQHSGALFQVGPRAVSKLRWERSRGASLNPEKFTPGTLGRIWETVEDFSDTTYPTGPAEFTTVLPLNLALLDHDPATEPRFDGKVVIVTGAGQGLGRCYALAFATLGASVVVNDVADPTPVVKEIISRNGTAVGCLASCEDGENIVRAAISAFGHVDILINNAGFLRDKAFVNLEQDRWDSVLDVHVNGTYRMTAAVWPYFVKQGKGSIINTSSTSGIYGVFGQANYSTAKLGIVGITEATAREGAKYGIRVNSIAPVAATGALAAAWANTSNAGKDLPMKPEYNVPAVLLLSSDSLNGRQNHISGGLFEIGCGWHAATRLRPISGCMFSEPSRMTPEAVAEEWGMLSDLPLVNIELKKSMEVLGKEYDFTENDVILYNISVGATRSDLPLVYERDPSFQALHTFGIIPFFSKEVISHHVNLLPKFDLKKSLLGEHYMEVLHYPIPTSGRLISTGRVLDVVDKGNAALVRTGFTTYNADTDQKLFYNEVSFFAGGAGGFGGQSESSGSRASTKSRPMPPRVADTVVQHQTSPEQAALYRLNADREDIHIDPKASRRSGFPTPILHGHCTMGIAGKYIFQEYGDIRSIKARFIGIVVPGDTLRIEMWKDGESVLYRVTVVETGKICIDQGYVSLQETEAKVARL